MALRDILKWPDTKLKEVAKPVDKVDDGVRRLAADLAETMYAAEGIGLAATQVGAGLRVIVIDPAFEGEESRLTTYINPEIIEGEGEVIFAEGCLSVPDIREEVTRYRRVKVRYLDLDGNEQIVDADFERDGILPVALQHEIDHLDGKVFVEYLSRFKQELIRRKMKTAQSFAASTYQASR